MDTEVTPVVREFVEEKRLSGPKLGTTELIAKLGVTDARLKRSDYAWTGTGNSVICTIWAELVHVHNNSRWYYVESLDVQTRLGGAARTAVQEKRARDKLELLKRVHDAKASFIAVLQINRLTRQELERNHASIAVLVRDDTEWRVARWDMLRKRAIFVRGPADWSPSDTEVDAALAAPLQIHDAIPAAAEPQFDEGSVEPQLVFPDQVTRDRVEAVAMAHMTNHFVVQGFHVHDVSEKNLGYDLEVVHADGALALKVEVKGTAGSRPWFFLTRNERACAARELDWRLAIVTDALGQAKQLVYSTQEMEQQFAFDALVWRCKPSP